MSDPRSTRRWRELRRRVLTGATHCTRCGGLLDWNARPKSTLSPSVDHIIPMHHGGSVYDPRNLTPMHYGCNSGKRDGIENVKPVPRRPW
jgi:5-methylcytosine-specific restriction endonuclease McrA